MDMVIGGEIVVALSFGVSPLILSVGSEILPQRLRIAAQGVLNMFIGLGGIFALLVGEALVTNSIEGWRTYYYIIAGELGFGALIFGLLYNPPPRPLQLSLSFREKMGMVFQTPKEKLILSLILTLWIAARLGRLFLARCRDHPILYSTIVVREPL